MNLFGKKKTVAPPPPPTATLVKLRENILNLDKREELLTTKSKNCEIEVKQKMAKKDQKGALYALKRKKLHDKEIENLRAAKMTLESQCFAIESATVNAETFLSMKLANDTLKAVHGNINADAVEDVMEEITNENEISDAISEAISRPVAGIGDDDELMNELKEMMAQDMEETLLQTPVVPARVQVPQSQSQGLGYNMPVLPNNLQQPPAESEDEKALKELQAFMA